MRKHITSKTAILTICILSAIAFYILACYTPLYVDDYFFDFFAAPEELKNIPAYRYFSFYTDRFAGVSRFIPHLAVAFTQWSGKWLFNILSTLGYMSLCILLSRAATHDKTKQIQLAAISAALLWFILPGFFQAFLWMSGACNYLFVAILVVFFYLSFTSSHNTTVNWWQAPLWFIYGFITGWTNEGFIVGLAAGCTLHLLLNRNQFRGRRLWLYCGLICGAIPLCLSPLNITRFMVGHSGPFSISGFIFGIAQSIFALTDIYITFLLILTFILILIYNRKSLRGGYIPQFCRTHIILITALAVSCAFLILSRHTSVYSRVPMEVYSLMLLLSIISFIRIKCLNFLGICSSAIILTSIICLLPTAISNTHSYDSFISQIRHHTTVINIKNVPLSSYERRYIVPASQCSWYNNIVETKHYVLSYYGGNVADEIVPEQLMTYQSELPMWGRLYFPSWKMSWIKIPDDAEIRNVTFLLSPVHEAWKKPMIPYLESLRINELPTEAYRVVTISDSSSHSKWLVVYDNSAIADRVRNIRVEHD